MVASKTMAGVRITAAMNPEALSAAIGAGFSKVMQALGAAGVAPAGPPCCVYRGMQGDQFVDDVGIPIAAEDAGKISTGEVKVFETPGGEAYRLLHKGPYPELESAYQAIMAKFKADGREFQGVAVETYLNDPASTPESELLTEILAIRSPAITDFA